MRTSSIILASAALVASTSAHSNVTYTTEIVTAYETYCPSPTEIVHGTKTYTVTKVSDDARASAERSLHRDNRTMMSRYQHV